MVKSGFVHSKPYSTRDHLILRPNRLGAVIAILGYLLVIAGFMALLSFQKSSATIVLSYELIFLMIALAIGGVSWNIVMLRGDMIFIKVDYDGFTIRNFNSFRHYEWIEVSDFSIVNVVGISNILQLVNFPFNLFHKNIRVAFNAPPKTFNNMSQLPLPIIGGQTLSGEYKIRNFLPPYLAIRGKNLMILMNDWRRRGLERKMRNWRPNEAELDVFEKSRLAKKSFWMQRGTYTRSSHLQSLDTKHPRKEIKIIDTGRGEEGKHKIYLKSDFN